MAVGSQPGDAEAHETCAPLSHPAHARRHQEHTPQLSAETASWCEQGVQKHSSTTLHPWEFCMQLQADIRKGPPAPDFTPPRCRLQLLEMSSL